MSQKNVGAQWKWTRADPPQSSCRAVCGLAESAKHFTASSATSNGPHRVQLSLCHAIASILDNTGSLMSNAPVLQSVGQETYVVGADLIRSRERRRSTWPTTQTLFEERPPAQANCAAPRSSRWRERKSHYSVYLGPQQWRDRMRGWYDMSGCRTLRTESESYSGP
jgi:hypothetical protein